MDTTATPVSQATIDAYYDSLRPFWHPVCTADALNEQTIVAAELLETPLAITHLNGELVAMYDVCRHFQAQLSLGEIRKVEGHGDCLMCPYHGWSYAADGQCVDIPQLGSDRTIPESARVDSYHVLARYGLIWVCLAEEPLRDIPTLPDVENPDYLTGPLRSYAPWVASAPRVIMAALDDTHGAWVHEGLVGDRAHPEAPDHKCWRKGMDLVVRFNMLQPNNATIDDGSNGDMREVALTTTVGIPNTIHFNIAPVDAENPHITLIWQAVCPARYNSTLTFWGSARNYDKDGPVYDEAFEHLQDTLREQDREIVESQRPWLLPPFWTKTELPVRPADMPLIEYQRWLEELGVVTRI
jgi:phenylpropionate dioxygenase-like ring-hydroxylating dioxygenase large terminal subunit